MPRLIKEEKEILNIFQKLENSDFENQTSIEEKNTCLKEKKIIKIK